MSDPLVTELEDHRVAGASYAIDQLGAMRQQSAGEPLGQFTLGMLAEVEADYAVFESLAKKIGTGSSGLKDISAWMAEKLSRLILNLRAECEHRRYLTHRAKL